MKLKMMMLMEYWVDVEKGKSWWWEARFHDREIYDAAKKIKWNYQQQIQGQNCHFISQQQIQGQTYKPKWICFFKFLIQNIPIFIKAPSLLTQTPIILKFRNALFLNQNHMATSFICLTKKKITYTVNNLYSNVYDFPAFPIETYNTIPIYK